MSNLDLLRTWYDRVWEHEEIEAIDELLAPEPTISGLEEGMFSDAEAYKLFWRLVFRILMDIRPVIHRHVSDGEWIAANLTLNAKIRQTGAPISVQSHVMVRFVGGKIVEGNNLINYIDAFQQLGLMPPRTLDQCLLGRRLNFG